MFRLEAFDILKRFIKNECTLRVQELNSGEALDLVRSKGNFFPKLRLQCSYSHRWGYPIIPKKLFWQQLKDMDIAKVSSKHDRTQVKKQSLYLQKTSKSIKFYTVGCYLSGDILWFKFDGFLLWENPKLKVIICYSDLQRRPDAAALTQFDWHYAPCFLA